MTLSGGQRRTTLRFPAQPNLKLDPGCVVSYCPIASSIGAQILHRGGNAVDAAVATALALTVTYPQAGNIGGGGFMMVHLPGGEAHLLDYRERAPSAASADLYNDGGGDDSKAVLGPLASAVPGTIAGLAEAHGRFGSLPWAELVEVVVPLADLGVWLTTRQAGALRMYQEPLRRFESTRRYFFRDDGGLLPPGTLFKQRDLARTLQIIADQGPRAFYEGVIATQIVDQVQSLGGVMTAADLNAYKPVWRTPLKRRFEGNDIYLPPCPSAGGLVAGFALGCAEATDVAETRYGSPQWVLTWARIFRAAFAFGNHGVGDPDQIDADEIARTHALATQAMSLDDFKRLEAELVPTGELLGDAAAAKRPSTTHFSIIDRNGMAVSNTYSANLLFGSKMAVAGAGFLLNNSMADFRIASGPSWYGLLQGERNRLAPQRRPATSMTPTIILKEGLVTMVVGGSGGPRIPTSIAQVVASVLAGGLSLSESVRRPRVHHQLFPADVVLEKGFPKRTVDRLREGYQLSVVPALGVVCAIRRRIEDNEISAVLDPRFGEIM